MLSVPRWTPITRLPRKPSSGPFVFLIRVTVQILAVGSLRLWNSRVTAPLGLIWQECYRPLTLSLGRNGRARAARGRLLGRFLRTGLGVIGVIRLGLPRGAINRVCSRLLAGGRDRDRTLNRVLCAIIGVPGALLDGSRNLIINITVVTTTF